MWVTEQSCFYIRGHMVFAAYRTSTDSQEANVGKVKQVLLQRGSSDRETTASDPNRSVGACCALVFAFALALAVGCATPAPYAPVSAATEKSDVEAVAKAIADRSGTVNDVQALFQAVASGNIEMVRHYLNKTSANSYRRDSGGDTLLMLAARAPQSNVQIVALLLDGGASINQKDDRGWTALDHANADSAPRTDRARFLMSRGGVSGKATATSVARMEEAEPAAQFPSYSSNTAS
jgi:hypothetical protein